MWGEQELRNKLFLFGEALFQKPYPSDNLQYGVFKKKTHKKTTTFSVSSLHLLLEKGISLNCRFIEKMGGRVNSWLQLHSHSTDTM